MPRWTLLLYLSQLAVGCLGFWALFSEHYLLMLTCIVYDIVAGLADRLWGSPPGQPSKDFDV